MKTTFKCNTNAPVAGVAFFKELISKTILIASDRGMRSFDTSVKT